jgi:hypothetical protein
MEKRMKRTEQDGKDAEKGKGFKQLVVRESKARGVGCKGGERE